MAKEKLSSEEIVERESKQEELRKSHDYVIKNKRVRRQSRRRAAVVVMLIFLMVVALLAGAAYTIMQFVDDNNFRINVSQEGTEWLSLSNDWEFTNPTSVLNVSGPQKLDNCTYLGYLEELLPGIIDAEGAYEGEGSSKFFMATTFYLTNSGEVAVEYNEMIRLMRYTKNMQRALRILVIKDEDVTDDDIGTIKVYGDGKYDESDNKILDNEGLQEKEEVVPGQHYTVSSDGPYDPDDINEDGVWMAELFQGGGYVLNSSYYPLEPGEKIKYTIVIWLEGWDEDCVDAILGGTVKLTVEFATRQEE